MVLDHIQTVRDLCASAQTVFDVEMVPVVIAVAWPADLVIHLSSLLNGSC
jgi:hypothetical protein